MAERGRHCSGDCNGLYRNLHLLEPNSIRILHLLPGLWSAALKAEMSTVSMDSEPQYEALSYTWGASTQGQSLLINDVSFLITDNLFDALRRLRLKLESRTIWVDAVCINQQDYEEKGRQIAIMGSIFHNATCVNVWLGEQAPSPQINTRNPFALLHRQILDFGASMNIQAAQWQSLQSALNTTKPPWYSRAWTIQEFALARKVIFYFGNQRLEYDGDLTRKILLRSPQVHRSVQSTMAYLPNNGQDDSTVLFAGRMRLLERVRDYIGKSSVLKPKPDLLRVMASLDGAMGQLVTVSATEPKDMVYCLTGLISDEEARFIGSDYTLPVHVVYARATFASIKYREDFAILEQVVRDRRQATAELPSWAVDFKPGFRFQTSLGEYATGGRSVDQPFVAPTLHSTSNGLSLRALNCDTVIDTIRIPVDYEGVESCSDGGELLLKAVCLVQKALENPLSTASSTSGIAVLRHILRLEPSFCVENDVCNTTTLENLVLAELETHEDGNEITDWLNEVFYSWTTLVRKLSTPLARKLKTPYVYPTSNFWKYCCMSDGGTVFTTSAGLVGFARSPVTEGDYLILARHHCPFLMLRPCGAMYEFGGFAYIHGAMSAKFWSKWRGEQLQTQDFVLC